MEQRIDEIDFIESDNEEEEQIKESFKVDSLELAAWAMKKIISLNEQDQKVLEYCDIELEKINTWKEKQLKSTQGSREYFESLLKDYFYRLRLENPKAKLSTPYGKVTSKKPAPKWVYDDPTLVKWLSENKPEFIKTVEEPKKAELKEKFKTVGNSVVDENGEIIDGITIIEQGEKITVKVE